MRKVAVEEHCLTPALAELLAGRREPAYHPPGWPGPLRARLLELGDERIATMDAGGIDVQVLSAASPGLEQTPPELAVHAARDFNDRLAEEVAAHPGRLSGFAALPTQEPEAAVAELTRAVRELGARGAMIHGRVGDRFLDDPSLWPILECADGLGVPLYLHPAAPSQAVYEAYYAGFEEELGVVLATHGWGWHIETGLHALRLVLSGALDRFPRLQVVIGHLGEALPFMLARSDMALGRALAASGRRLELPVAGYFARNFLLTTSGFFSPAPFRCALDTFGAERILFAVDHPFADAADACRFLEQAPVTEQQRELIAHATADRLLGLG